MLKTNQAVAIEVILGKWGNGAERRKRLTNAGYNYENVQSIVNALCEGDISDFQPEPEQVYVKGTEVMNIEIDLDKYCALNIEFINGGEFDADTSA